MHSVRSGDKDQNKTKKKAHFVFGTTFFCTTVAYHEGGVKNRHMVFVFPTLETTQQAFLYRSTSVFPKTKVHVLLELVLSVLALMETIHTHTSMGV